MGSGSIYLGWWASRSCSHNCSLLEFCVDLKHPLKDLKLKAWLTCWEGVFHPGL